MHAACALRKTEKSSKGKKREKKGNKRLEPTPSWFGPPELTNRPM